MKERKRKRILITGGSGMVGQYMKDEAERWGYDVFNKVKYLSSVDCDLQSTTQTRACFKIFKPDIVIHLAAKVGGIITNSLNPVEFYEENTCINMNVVKMCHEYNAKLIAMGSTCSYPDKVDKYPMTEEDIFNGPPTWDHFAYAMSKRGLITHIESYNKEYNKNWCYIIPCNIYGKYDKYDQYNGHFLSSFIKRITTLVETTTLIELFGTGEPLRQHIYAGDVAKILWIMINRNITESFNVCPDENLNINHIAETTLQSCLREDLKIVHNPTKLDGQYRKDVSNTKMKNIFEDKCISFDFTPLSAGIRLVYDYLIEQQESLELGSW